MTTIKVSEKSIHLLSLWQIPLRMKSESSRNFWTVALSRKKSLMQRKNSYWGCNYMVNIPEEFAESIKTIVEWHLSVYVPDIIFDSHLKRILEHFFERNMVDGKVQLEENELYYINECVSNAINNIPECGIERNVAWNIHDWVVEERKRANI